jgi:hypothetical protein
LGLWPLGPLYAGFVMAVQQKPLRVPADSAQFYCAACNPFMKWVDIFCAASSGWRDDKA